MLPKKWCVTISMASEFISFIIQQGVVLSSPTRLQINGKGAINAADSNGAEDHEMHELEGMVSHFSHDFYVQAFDIVRQAPVSTSGVTNNSGDASDSRGELVSRIATTVL